MNRKATTRVDTVQLKDCYDPAEYMLVHKDHYADLVQQKNDRIRELESRDHCPCEDCKRARASESETGAK